MKRHNSWITGWAILILLLAVAAILYNCVGTAMGATEGVPDCGEMPLHFHPDGTVNYNGETEQCDELPPAGFHAGVAWQTDEFNPGLEEKVVDLLKLESYYNWQLKPRTEYKEWEEEYWTLALKHVPMLYDPLDPNSCEPGILCLIPTHCEFQLVWNEPDAVNQANASPVEVANFNARYARQQANLCAWTEPNWGTTGTLLVDLDAWNISGPIQQSYVRDYLLAGGPVPTAWTVHIYADTWEQWLFVWEAVDALLELVPEIDRPVIVTEAACVHPDIEERKRCISGVAELVETSERLHSVYWFVGEGWTLYEVDYTLADSEPVLTELGQHFMQVRGYAPNQFIGVVVVKQVTPTPTAPPSTGDPPTPTPTLEPTATVVPTATATATATAISPTETPVPGCEGIPAIPPAACYNGNPNPPPFCFCYEG